jgi:hypothetical protein
MASLTVLQAASRSPASCLRRVCGDPDDVGVDRDLDDEVAGEVVWPAGVEVIWSGGQGDRRTPI